MSDPCKRDALILYQGYSSIWNDVDWLSLSFSSDTSVDFTGFSAKFKIGNFVFTNDDLSQEWIINLTASQTSTLPIGLNNASLIVYDVAGEGKPFSTNIPVFVKDWEDGEVDIDTYNATILATLEDEVKFNIKIETAKVSLDWVNDKIAEHNVDENAHAFIQEKIDLGLGQETEAREQADSVLNQKIETERNRAISAEGALGTRINNEASERATVDTELALGIAMESNRATAVEGNLADLNTAQKSNLVAGINSVVSSLNDEVTRATNAEDDINTRLTNERNDRIAGDNALGGRILGEENRAKGVEGNLANLTTSDKTNLVNAINEVRSDVNGVASDLSREAGIRATRDTQLALDIGNEATVRASADNNLQQQIDAITAASDVTDIVGTYADLVAYDTSDLPNNSIIKVLKDEAHDDETTYYRWVITAGVGAWVLIGEEGPYYTKSEANSTFVPQTRTINGKPLTNNISLDAEDVGAISSLSFSMVVEALGYTPYDSSNPAGYTSNIGTVTKVNNVSPDSSGNVSLTIPTINSTNNYVPYRSGASSFGNSTLLYNANAMAFTGKLVIGNSSPASYYNKGRLVIYDNAASQNVSSLALLNYGGGGGSGVSIDMYNTSANGGIPSGRFALIDNGNYSGYMQLMVKKSGAQSNPLLPALNIIPVPAANSLTTCVSFGQDEFNRVLFDLHKPEATTTITDADKRWSGSGTTYQVVGNNKFNPRLLVAVGDIVSFNNFSTEATVTGVVSNSSTLQITTNVSLGTVSYANISVKKAYFKITDENYNMKVYIDPYGKFGLGTGTPAYDLDVNGTINASTDVKVNGQSVALAATFYWGE